MSTLKSSRNGFTLIELLVTITIIAILSAIGLVVYSNALKQGRDGKRQADLRSIQSALEQYNSDQGFYPASLSFGAALTNCTGNPASPCSLTKTYFNNVPNDTSSTYVYSPSASGCDNTSGNQCNNYCLYAKLDLSGSLPALCSPPPSGGYNFAVTPP